MLNLYKITRPGKTGFDEYYGAVVAAGSPLEARYIHPAAIPGNNFDLWDGNEPEWGFWINAKDVVVEYLGVAGPDVKKGVILSSFRNG